MSNHPIHQPCPDMEGCKNFDPALKARSLEQLRKLRAKHQLKAHSNLTGGCDFRYSREYQVQARRAFKAQKGLL
ncbi:hypothetical protein [Thaumasiovibrio subtropicus]|uniref:hypothetical protein n=1 Tax=Thaumasiovibrio subtropicus TaxID=1891207 RepID=UPI000B35D4CF|nr:hypothetical protein [Thaumasiovibrio subtropicus]